MKVLVAGGSGVIGQALLPRLVAAGHEVVVTTRRQSKVQMLEQLGVTPIVLDALDEAAVCAAVRSFRPGALMNQMTSLPKDYNPRRLSSSYAATNRLHVEGTRNLLRAATEVGARHFIYQSIGFMYAMAGPRVLDEGAPLAVDAPKPFGGLVRATLEGERMALSSGSIVGVVLRYGQLYGPGTYLGRGGDFERQAKLRILPIIGSGGGLFSFVHVDDAAASAVAALERGTGVYNITDDEPVAAREWIPAFCCEAGAPPPFRLPSWVGRIAAGSFPTALLSEGRGASNAKAKRELGWLPSHPTWRAGFFAA